MKVKVEVEMARAKRASIVFKVFNVRISHEGWKRHPFIIFCGGEAAAKNYKRYSEQPDLSEEMQRQRNDRVKNMPE